MLFLYNLNASKKWVAAYLGRILNDESQACGTTTARLSCPFLNLVSNIKRQSGKHISYNL